MFQFSRAIYRELAPFVERESPDDLRGHRRVLRACESAVDRLANDRHYFARPARTLFNDIRFQFPVSAQPHVYRVVDHYLELADEFFSQLPRDGCDANGQPLRCRAMTRKGSACQRMPLPHNGYCPSHQHLAETEDSEAEVEAALAAA
jgi:hypothetical protein